MKSFLNEAKKDFLDDFHNNSEISLKTIEDCLCLYPSERRHLKQLKYFHGTLSGAIEPHDIEYSIIKVDYYTAQQVIEITSQISYILAGVAFEKGDVRGLNPSIFPIFKKRLMEGKIYYSSISIRFKKPTSNKLFQPISASILKVTNTRMFCIIDIQINFGSQSCFIQGKLVMKTGGDIL